MSGGAERAGPAGAAKPAESPPAAPALRLKAEASARQKTLPPADPLEALSPDETRQTLHELRVHQIELEMQNEELRRAQAELDAARARYFDLYDLAPVGYCTLSAKGLIVEANLTAAALLGVARGALVSQPLSRFIFREDQDIYYRHRKQLLEALAPLRPDGTAPAGEPQACELRLVKRDGSLFWVHLAATVAPEPAAAPDGDPCAHPLPAAGGPVCRVTLSDITARKRADELLQHYNAELERQVAERTAVAERRTRQLQSLDRRLIRAEEAERQRIGHLLHEEVQQILVAARMALCTALPMLKDTEPELALLNVDRMLREAMEETRALVHEMVPPGLREGGLAEAVSWLARHMRERFNFTVTVTADEDLPPLDHAVSICAYQAVREMLLNIDKHARVRQAEVLLQRPEKEWLSLTVRDEGVGFAADDAALPEECGNCSGLVSIRERVEGFGGRMQIISAAGQGTSVRLLLPAQRRAR